ncbi:MAG: hypothetical protein ACAI25_14750, partial [Planctomycetota bacterium]
MRSEHPRGAASALLVAAALIAPVATFAEDDKAGEAPAKKRAASDAPVPTDAATSEREAGRPGRALIHRERDFWNLEGKLVAEAQALLRSPELKKDLGDDALVSGEAEAQVRAWLHGKRAAAHRDAARKFFASCDRPTRELIERAAQPAELAPEDVLMDWLTYEGLYDLALVRDSWRRFKAGGLEGADKELASSFFADLAKAPESSAGITVAAPDDKTLDVSVFGAKVRASVLSSKVEHRPAVGPVGLVEWRSNYEKLRAQLRRREAADPIKEELVQEDGRYRPTYALEVDEYLVGGATQPWALSLALASADDLADLYAGFEASTGARCKGFTIMGTQTATALGAAKPQRGKFVIVTI